MSHDISNQCANHRLIYWQQRAGFNNTRLAATIRERAGKRGHRHVQPDARRVRAWRQGERPRDPVPELILEVFSERIGAPLTLSDVGLDRSGGDRARWDGPWLLVQTVTELITFARADLMLGRRGAGLRPQEFLGGQGFRFDGPAHDGWPVRPARPTQGLLFGGEPFEAKGGRA